MTVNQYLNQAQKQLETAGIGTARLDALVLLEDVLGHDRAWVLAHPEHEISAEKARRLTNLLKRRSQHEPLAYIRGHTEFYGRKFVITSDVLEPRSESETLIDLLKALPVFDRLDSSTSVQRAKSRKTVKIGDVGTGSGALGITTALELQNTQVDLLDIDPKALKVAKINVDKFTLNLNVVKSDLLADTRQDYDVLVCNLPYVPDNFEINLAAGREPKVAIFGGPDGLDIYRRLFKQIKARTVKPLYILIEALPTQHAVLDEVVRQAGYKIIKKNDFIQVLQRQK